MSDEDKDDGVEKTKKVLDLIKRFEALSIGVVLSLLDFINDESMTSENISVANEARTIL